jgi:hypothetical protein
MLLKVSLTPAIYCSPVSTTLPINFSTGDKLYWQQRPVLSAKLSPAAKVGPGLWYYHWKRRKGTSHTLIRGPWGCHNYFNPKRNYIVFSGLRGLWSRCGMFMDATFYGGSNDTIGGRVRRRRPEISTIFSYTWKLPTSLLSLFLSLAINLLPVSLSRTIIVHCVVITTNKFITSGIVTGDNC